MELGKNNKRSGYSVVARSKNRLRILSVLFQPMTATQLSRRTGLSRPSCCESLRELRRQGVVECLNSRATMSRIYWLTDKGRLLQSFHFKSRDVKFPQHDFPIVDWEVYGQVCSTHRRMIIQILGRQAMQPCRIKRLAYHNDPTMKMSSNNCRDSIRFLLKHDVVRKVLVRKKRHPQYELTELGTKIHQLLNSALSRR